MKKQILYICLSIAFIVLLIVANIALKKENEDRLSISDSSEEEVITNSKVIEVTSETFESEVLNSDKPVLIDFYASWCNPCKIIVPIIEKISSENDSVKFVRVNIEQEDLAFKYKIAAFPTLVLIVDGNEVDRITGLVPKSTIEDFINYKKDEAK